jgi:murein L,D-transpeptidase YafK
MSKPLQTPAPKPEMSMNEGSSNRKVADLLAKSSTITPAPEVEDRVAYARGRHGESIKRHCTETGLNYPPSQIFFRAFKHEGEIEAWGSDKGEPMKLIKAWPLTAQSGVPGPKRREGDRQIPEGCYEVVVFNPKSNYHLSLGLDYPNAADRVHSDKEKPGFDIYIHGNQVSIGCLAIGDDMIEELYLLALDFRKAQKDPIPVHIFPARMQGSEWENLKAGYSEHVNFWGELEPIYRAFEQGHRLPEVKVDSGGTYVIEG